MPVMRKSLESPEPNANRNHESGGIRSESDYELCRQEKIKENLQLMQSLGIFDLSVQLKSKTRPAKRSFGNSDSSPKSTRDTPPLQHSGPTRRSSRLQNLTPVSYSEDVAAKKGKALGGKGFQLEEGAREEIYTEEHEKLLGNTERSWTLFVDGYGKDGKRIYDPVMGKTCHQCRQKTLGYRTQCSQCNLVQGQFCGDCLYMRYGEHVHEALENPNWICPACRGICNCSLCRTQKGWLPTGAIYRRISKLGFKSVAHYLIQTKRSQTNSDKETDATPNQTSVKRSLSFKEADELAQEQPHLMNAADGLLELPKLDDGGIQNGNHHADARTDGDSLQKEEDNKMNNPQDGEYADVKIDGDALQKEQNSVTDENLASARRSLSFFPLGDKQVSVVDVEVECDLKPSKHLCSPEKENNEQSGGAYDESSLERTKKRKVSVEPNAESVAGRLKQRRRRQSGSPIEEIA